jgi:hypothetical protein
MGSYLSVELGLDAMAALHYGDGRRADMESTQDLELVFKHGRSWIVEIHSCERLKSGKHCDAFCTLLEMFFFIQDS